MEMGFEATVLKLQAMTSPQAAGWLLRHHPVIDPGHAGVLQLIARIRWAREEQLLLARHYLGKTPFTRLKVYELFATIMSFDLFLTVIRELRPAGRDEFNLFLYYLQPLLEHHAKTCMDRDRMKEFIHDHE